jgi:hypothetical protein
MRYHEFARPNGLFNWVPSLSALTGFKVGFVEDARRAATPYVVDCHRLAREVIGDRKFERQFSERRDWCKTNCPDGHEIEPIRDHLGRLTGRRFRFARGQDATKFKMLFC